MCQDQAVMAAKCHAGISESAELYVSAVLHAATCACLHGNCAFCAPVSYLAKEMADICVSMAAPFFVLLNTHLSNPLWIC